MAAAADTLIVGAGPVGLTAALELTRRGIPVRIIEKRATPPSESRALGINPRTLDILEASGATQRFLAEGLPVRRARLVSRGKPIGSIDFAKTGHRFGRMTILPQARTAAILEELLNARGVGVEREATYAGHAASGDRLICRIEGRTETEIACKTLIGCDGPRSVVRDAAGIGFPGSAYEHDWTLADIEADWPHEPDSVGIFFSREGMLLVLPVVPGVWRFVSSGTQLEPLIPAEARLGAIKWRSHFRIAHRLADRFHSGPVFLAGDSAHIHSPAGARGMNGGIEDAATLAWLMQARQTQRYHALRRPAAESVLAQVDRQTRMAQMHRPLALWLREIAAGTLLRFDPVQRFAANFITALDSPRPEWLGRDAAE